MRVYTLALSIIVEQIAGDLLVPCIRRRRHVMLSVDQLVPLPVIGEEHEVVVGELHPRMERFHGVAPGHRRIVPTETALHDLRLSECGQSRALRARLC